MVEGTKKVHYSSEYTIYHTVCGKCEDNDGLTSNKILVNCVDCVKQSISTLKFQIAALDNELKIMEHILRKKMISSGGGE